MNIILSAIELYAPVTERSASLNAWHKAVAVYHRAKTSANAASCDAAYARTNAAPKDDYKIIQGPASPVCPF